MNDTNDGSIVSTNSPQPAAGPLPDRPNAPMKAKAPRLEPGINRGKALVDSAGLACRQALWNWEAFEAGGDEEAIHQMRVALRRLRVALKAFRAEQSEEVWRRFSEEAKALGTTVGELRDLDVLALDIVAPLEAVPEKPDIAALRTVLDGARRTAREALVETLLAPRWIEFRSKLALWPMQVEQQLEQEDGAVYDRSARKAGYKALRRLWKRIDEAADDVDTLDIERRHALRKDLRRLRYAVELIAPLADDADAGRMITEIRRLQYSLGHLNDLATAHRLVEMSNIRDHADPAVQRASGFVIGWHAARSQDTWRETKDALARLQRMPRFWE